jgi:hypothetical protein
MRDDRHVPKVFAGYSQLFFPLSYIRIFYNTKVLILVQKLHKCHSARSEESFVGGAQAF